MTKDKINIKKPELKNVVLQVLAYGNVLKPMNGPAPRSTLTTFLKLDSTVYYFKGTEKIPKAELAVNGGSKAPKRQRKTRDVIKQETSDTYLLKGFRGTLRHSCMEIAKKSGIEVCHSSEKIEDKDKNSFLPAGFHANGSCGMPGCIIHRIFGSRGVEGKIRVRSDPITTIKEPIIKISRKVQNIKLGTENRVCLSYDHKAIQDFKERTISGELMFEIFVDKLDDEELGFITLAAMNIRRFGRGYNSGYGELHIKGFQMVERTSTRKAVVNKDGNGFKFTVEDITVDKLVEDDEIFNRAFGAIGVELIYQQ
ncbi:MAG: RAMP superfamily CRISPR-associated protein [Candidatus Hodarchaeales archaeon]